MIHMFINPSTIDSFLIFRTESRTWLHSLNKTAEDLQLEEPDTYNKIDDRLQFRIYHNFSPKNASKNFFFQLYSRGRIGGC